MKTLNQFLNEATQKKLTPGTEAHFIHHVKGFNAASELEHDPEDKLNYHWGELDKHYKPGAEYTRGTNLHDLDLGSDAKSIKDAYHRVVVGKGKVGNNNYGLNEAKLEEDKDDGVRKQKIMHKGEHVATIHTFQGRSGGWMSGAHTPDGSSASEKYGIGVNDAKREMIKKIKLYHKENN